MRKLMIVLTVAVLTAGTLCGADIRRLRWGQSFDAVQRIERGAVRGRYKIVKTITAGRRQSVVGLTLFFTNSRLALATYEFRASDDDLESGLYWHIYAVLRRKGYRMSKSGAVYDRQCMREFELIAPLFNIIVDGNTDISVAKNGRTVVFLYQMRSRTIYGGWDVFALYMPATTFRRALATANTLMRRKRRDALARRRKRDDRF